MAGEILRKEVVYQGEEYKRESLQALVTEYQERHGQEVKDLDRLRQTHDEIAREMRKDLVADKSAWECVKDMMTLDVKKMGSNFHGLLEKIPVLNDYVADRPVADLLREKIHLAETRSKQVGQFLDQVEAQIEALRLDIARLNQKVVQAAENEEKAASYILELRDHQQQVEEDLRQMAEDAPGAVRRQKQAELDEVKRLIWEHGGKLRLYSNAEDRIASIVLMNNNFLEILTNLHTNMTILFESSQEILDELRGHVTGLATATEASELTMSMQKSIDSLKVSVNKVATLASETSLYLTQNVDKLMSQMRVYDDATRTLIESNLAAEREIHEKRVDETIELAQKEYAVAAGIQASGGMSVVTLEGEPLEQYLDWLDRLIDGARLNRFFPDPVEVRTLYRFLRPSCNGGTATSVRVDLRSGLPAEPEVSRVLTDAAAARTRVPLVEGDTSSEAARRRQARQRYHQALAAATLPSCFSLSLALRRIEPGARTAHFTVTFDRFDVGDGVFVRYTILLAQTDSRWTRPQVELVGDDIRYTENFRNVISRFTVDEAEFAFLLLSDLKNVHVEEVMRCRIGPLYYRGMHAPEPWDAWLEEHPTAFVMHFPTERAGRSVVREGSHDPMEGLYRDYLSAPAREGVEPRVRQLGYKVWKERKFSCSGDMKDALDGFLAGRGFRCLIQSV